MGWLEENPDRKEPDLEEIRRRFAEEADVHYRYLWSSFDDHQRSAVTRVATGKSIPDSMRHVLDELEAKEYVVTRKERCRLFATAFEAFVRMQAAHAGRRPALSRCLPWKRG